MSAPESEDVEVCVVGLGVSSIALLRLLVRSGTSFVVITEREFGIWSLLEEHDEDFDLLSSNALASFSWWDVPLDFHFFSSVEYLRRLRADVTPEIRARVRRARATRYVERTDGGFDVHTANGALVRCQHLVVTAAQSVNGPKICETLGDTLKMRNQTVFIEGYGDTSNQYMARLMLGDNRVIISTRHFQNLDKAFAIGPGEWAPLDTFEPYQYLATYNHERSYRSALCTAVSPYSSSWISSTFRKSTGLDELMTPSDFYRDDLPPPWWSYLLRTGVNAGFGLPVKYWSVESFFALFDGEYREHMLKHRMLLNDPYFFMKRGQLRIVHPKRVSWVDEDTCEIDGERVHIDTRIEAPIARPRPVQVELASGEIWTYRYRESLYGVWSAERPRVYFVGSERPTTGAFAATSEIHCEFIHRLIHDTAFHSRLSTEYKRRYGDWIHHYLESGQEYENLEHTQFTGMTNEELTRVMGVGRRLWPSLQAGEFASYLTGPGIPARYPALNKANAQYQEFCRRWTNMFAGGLIAKLVWMPLLGLNLAVLGVSLGSPVWIGLGVLLVVPFVTRVVNSLLYDILSFGEMTSIYQHLAIVAALCAVGNGFLLAAAPTALTGLLAVFVRSGVPLLVLVAVVDIARAYVGAPLLFNDVRGKEAFNETYERYLEATRATEWYQHRGP